MRPINVKTIYNRGKEIKKHFHVLETDIITTKKVI